MLLFSVVLRGAFLAVPANREPEVYLTPGFSGSGNLLLTRNSDLDSTVHRIEIIILAYCSIYILHAEQGLIISRLLIKDLDE